MMRFDGAASDPRQLRHATSFRPRGDSLWAMRRVLAGILVARRSASKPPVDLGQLEPPDATCAVGWEGLLGHPSVDGLLADLQVFGCFLQ